MFIDTGVRKTHSMIGDSVAFCSARLGAQKVRYVYITVCKGKLEWAHTEEGKR